MCDIIWTNTVLCVALFYMGRRSEFIIGGASQMRKSFSFIFVMVIILALAACTQSNTDIAAELKSEITSLQETVNTQYNTISDLMNAINEQIDLDTEVEFIFDEQKHKDRLFDAFPWWEEILD